MILRTVRPHDLEGLNRIEKLCFGERSRFPPEAIAELIIADNVSGMVAQKDEIVGFLFMLLEQGSIEALILTVDVHPDHRNEGVGRVLVENAIDVAQGLGRKRVVLQVSCDNAEGIALYNSTGFTKTGMVKDYYGSGNDAWEMELRI